MNKSLLLVLVAVISFVAGVAVTKVLSPDNFEMAITPRQKELQKIAIEAEKSPFFPVSAPLGNESSLSSSQRIEEKNSLDSYKDSQRVISKFNQEISLFRDKRFVSIQTDPKIAKANQIAYRNEIKNLFQENKIWFKALVEYNEQHKLYFWIYHYQCDDPGMKGKKSFDSNNVCFFLKVFALSGEKWEEDAISSNVDYIVWLGQEAYITMELMDRMKYFSPLNNLLSMTIPAPDNKAPLEFLKYDKGKLVWETGREVEWMVTSEKESSDFEKKVHAAIAASNRDAD